MKKYDVALFIHDLHPHIGHSRALIETVNNFPSEEVNSLHIIAYESSEPSELFPQLKDRVFLHKVPSTGRLPFIFKMLFFFVMTWFYKRLCLPANCKTIGLGIASLSVDYVNLQFVHKEWDHFYFKNTRLSPINFIYKKLLHFLFFLGEKYLYQFKSSTHFSVLAEFEKEYLHQNFNVPKEHMITNYSSVNTDDFDVQNTSRDELIKDLQEEYPELAKLDKTKPIYLFIGALERKGVNYAIKALKADLDSQFIIIGRPESGNDLNIKLLKGWIYIPFTKRVKDFYALADTFIFPTIYEPFGLVLTEAASMGLEIYTTSFKVGASEILKGMPLVHLFNTPEDLKITPRENPLSIEEKRSLSEKRKEVFKEISWEKAGQSFWKLITEN